MMDEETFMGEVEAMERALYRVSRSLLKSPEDCADAVQEALARAWARRGRVEAAYFRPWLMRIVINECHTIGRKRRRVVSTASMSGYPLAFSSSRVFSNFFAVQGITPTT